MEENKPIKKEMTREEFETKYMTKNKFFDFTKFKILCKKCGSDKVEYDSTSEVEFSPYYENEIDDIERTSVCKCHDCGNAFKITKYE